MRIIAGRFKGMPIPAALKGTRPTTDRTKEAIFSHLSAQGYLDDARVLDLYAGTGALGFEALSRGGRQLVAVEYSRKAASLIGQSAAKLKASPVWQEDDSIQVITNKVERYLAAPAKAFDLIFIDPPYAMESVDCDQLLAQLGEQGAAVSGALVVLERSTRSPEPQLPQGWNLEESKSYGETAVYYCVKE
ncbi:DNA methyltransferase [Bombiscardovia apis]|uniref:DNA methyltransferase n=1 Tax=Bombiscardovia apis TaxID=2932182 RepID=A0ABN6SF75_9BIFI|nr:DNA methyltransferase [Bombiscardovia apis]